LTIPVSVKLLVESNIVQEWWAATGRLPAINAAVAPNMTAPSMTAVRLGICMGVL
jgi:hypothetical protein